ncbi:Class E basic helix-loop-helix protein 41 [Chelonia mydas]|uniref:Class E basic helix-loop-helix protein 41 n=1 Tax=Chelonia mydas TaxID=8469 RepID=M7BL89_CHEMY|nr:Class E basic helix-loop-helix protein 41 [Chelonia mydas]
MDEGIPRLQDRQLLEHVDFIGLDYPSLYLCKPKRGMKRDESKETYKLPHRLIEKKRRDRINECIAQLKDLLPEHLKLTTLGHLEKAVVLELTLKHLKALTALTEQQHQNIIALQNGERSMKSPIQCDLDAFHSGFQTCAKEVLQYLSRFESWTPREQRCAQLVNHLHAVSTQFLPSPQLLTPQVPVSKGSSSSSCAQDRTGQKLEAQTNCVPVIQRTHPPVELGGENDTDTDSGYGGESEGRPDREKGQAAGLPGLTIKQEPAGDEAPAPKRLRLDSPPAVRPPAPAAAPLCLPFYFISPSAAAAYMQPLLDKSNLEKYLYQAAAPIPLLYSGIPAQAAAAFPCLSSGLAPADKANAAAASALLPLDLVSPGQHLPHLFAAACETGPSLDSDLPSPEDLLQPGKESP